MILERSTSEIPGTHPQGEAWDPSRGVRIGPAWDQLVDTLGDGHWHPWIEVVETVLPDSGLQPKTVQCLIYSGIRNGYLVRKGRYGHRSKTDTRMLRLINKEPRT